MRFKTQKLLVATIGLAFVAIIAATAGVSGTATTVGFEPSKSEERIQPQPFEAGEELLYVGEISRSVLRKIDVAEFRFTARRESLSKPHNGTSYSLKFTGDVTSKGFFTRLFNFKFRQRVESIVEPGSFTVQKTSRVDEQGKRARNSETVYDRAKGQVVWVERDPNNPLREPRTASTAFSGRLQDVLSAIYYLRTQPLKVGEAFELTVSDSGRVFQVPVKVVEKKRMKTVLGRVETVQVDPQLFGPGKMLETKGELSIWMTNDKRRVPVKARIKTEHGTFDITLRKVIQKSGAETPTASLVTP